MKVCRVKEIRELDRKAIREFGIPAEILMEDAGNAVYQMIRRETEVNGKSFVVLCGPGNNGGDGFVVARFLESTGAGVIVFIIADKNKYPPQAKKNLKILSNSPVEISENPSVPSLKKRLAASDYIVDALLGTGVDRPVEGKLKQVIDLINKSTKKVFAVDIPSGINGGNGQEMGISVKADCTVTFGLPKVGNLLYPGFGQGGKLYVSNISFPSTLTNSPELKIEIPTPIVLPPRKAETNKKDYGPIIVIAGAANYYWAPYASAYSFLKAGGGYVYLACPSSLVKTIAPKGREIVFLPQAETPSGSIAYKNKKSLLDLANSVKMVILGPGMSKNEETQQLIRELTREIEVPLIIDADGINASAGKSELLNKRHAPTVLTPHVGEMSRLIGKTYKEIETDRVNLLQKAAMRLNSVIVLKGPHSLVGYPDGKVHINVSGTTCGEAGMATAGSGDVLNGVIAAAYCLGMGNDEAVDTGVFIHGLAGDLAAKAKGSDGMIATDILEGLPDAVKYYRNNVEEIAKNYYDTICTI